MPGFPFCILAGLIAAVGAPVAAEVTSLSDDGFALHNEAEVAAAPALVWDALLKPADWWSDDHTYSGAAANMTIRPSAGGCFCEAIPEAKGEIEHMRVVYVAPASILRMFGGLGPLQSEAVSGALTIMLEPAGEGTKLSWDYVVGGYMRTSMAEIAPLIDQVVSEQFSRLVTRLGKAERADGRAGF